MELRVVWVCLGALVVLMLLTLPGFLIYMIIISDIDFSHCIELEYIGASITGDRTIGYTTGPTNYDSCNQYAVPQNGIVGHLYLPTPVNACSYISPPPGRYPTNYTWIALVYDYPACPTEMVINIRNAGYALIIASSENDSHRTITREVSDTLFPIVVVEKYYAYSLKRHHYPIIVSVHAGSTWTRIITKLKTAGYISGGLLVICVSIILITALLCSKNCGRCNCTCKWGIERYRQKLKNLRRKFEKDTCVRNMDELIDDQEDQGVSDAVAALIIRVQNSEESDFKEAALEIFAYPNSHSSSVGQDSALQLLSQFPNGVATCSRRYRYFGILLLHNACLNGWYNVVKMLVENYDCCDPKINIYQPSIYCTIVAILLKTLFSIFQLKNKVRVWGNKEDLVETLNINDGTALHCACKAGHLDIVKFLVEQGCDPTCRNVINATPLHFACWEGHLDIVKCLVDKMGCDPACTAAGLTPLHLACWKGHLDTVKFLVEKGFYKACMTAAVHRLPPLHFACQKAQLDVVKLLIIEQKIDPASRDCNGYTPLHIACEYGRLNIVKFLVTEQHCNHLQPSNKKSSVTPLELANYHYDVSSFLTSPGVSRQARYEYLSRTSFPPAFKVFVMGNHSVGKSTLVKAIQNRLTNMKWFGSFTDRFKRVSGVELNTAGIIPTSIGSERLGNIIMYDLAGQYQYYSSHAALLENLVAYPGSLLMIVVDLSMDKNDIIQQLQYWNSFIESHCSRNSRKPDVVVVGSHADVVKSQLRKLKEKSTDILKAVFSSLQMPQEIIPLNCTQLASSGLNEVCDVIGNYCSQFRQEISIDIRLNFLHAFLCQDFKGVTACRVSEIVSKISMGEEWDAETVSQYLTTISDKSQFLYLRSDQNVSDSWLILDQRVLLSQVNGTVFAPENFKEYHVISNSTGVVPFSKFKESFPKCDPEMIISFMSHLEFCHRIAEPEAAMIHGGRLEDSNQQFEKLYFFPALVSADRPKESCISIDQTHYKCGWSLQCIRPDQFLSSRFLHVLLLRLAFSFALAFEPAQEDEVCPVFQRRCNVWKAGIHWQNRDGVEAIVEVVEHNTAVTVMMGCLEGREVLCARARSEVIQTILKVKERFCRAVDLIESLIHPAELSSYPLKSPKLLSSFTITELAIAIAEGKQVVTNKRRNDQSMLKVCELLPDCEPYTCFNLLLLAELFRVENSDKEVPSIFYTHSNICQLLSKATPTFLVELFKDEHSDQEVLSTFYTRSNICKILSKLNLTYKALRSALDKCSVFCGRNPLLLAGRTLQSPLTSAPSTSIVTLQPTDNWQYLTISKNCTAIIRALAANKLSESLAEEFKARQMIGDTVYANATNHGPDITEYTRMKHLTTAILTSTKSSPQRYYDFITVLQMDGIREDAEAALALLPTDLPAASPEAVTAPQHQQQIQQTEMHTNCHTASVGKSAEKSRLDNSAMPQHVQIMETTFTEAAGPSKMQVYDSHPPPSKVTLSHELSNTLPLRTKPMSTRKRHGQESATRIIIDLSTIPDGSSYKSLPTSKSYDYEEDLDTIPHKSARSHHQLQDEDLSTTIAHRTDRPHLQELQCLQGRGGRRVKVIESVTAEWEELAKALHFESSVIEHVRHTFHQTEDACQDMLRNWLEGQEETRQPVNWDTLIDSLIEAGFVDIATDLQEAVEDYPIDVVCV